MFKIISTSQHQDFTSGNVTQKHNLLSPEKSIFPCGQYQDMFFSPYSYQLQIDNNQLSADDLPIIFEPSSKSSISESNISSSSLSTTSSSPLQAQLPTDSCPNSQSSVSTLFLAQSHWRQVSSTSQHQPIPAQTACKDVLLSRELNIYQN